jgi:hypothetical protein
VLISGPGDDHQVSALHFIFAAHDLADWSDRIDDGRAGRVCHEALQRFQDAGARWLIRKRKHVSLFRLESGNRRLQDLN